MCLFKEIFKINNLFLNTFFSERGVITNILIMADINKKFNTFESFYYEDERLHTFIDWPIKFIEPKNLAKNGFFYLREKDYVACIFCNGIIGNWEADDVPEDEHKKHYPNCKFINGNAVGNVPSNLGRIIKKIKEDQQIKEQQIKDEGYDICGLQSLYHFYLLTVKNSLTNSSRSF